MLISNLLLRLLGAPDGRLQGGVARGRLGQRLLAAVERGVWVARVVQVLARLVVGGVEEVEPVLAVGVDHGLVADVGVEDGVVVPEVGAAMHKVAPEKQDAVCWQLQQLPLIVDEHPKLGGPLAGCDHCGVIFSSA